MVKPKIDNPLTLCFSEQNIDKLTWKKQFATSQSNVMLKEKTLKSQLNKLHLFV